MRDRQRTRRARKARFADISVVPDDDERELLIGPPDDTAHAARSRRVRAAGSSK